MNQLININKMEEIKARFEITKEYLQWRNEEYTATVRRTDDKLIIIRNKDCITMLMESDMTHKKVMQIVPKWIPELF